jgi:hypothetical protein
MVDPTGVVDAGLHVIFGEPLFPEDYESVDELLDAVQLSITTLAVAD